MTRIAMGHGWKIHEIAIEGRPMRVGIQLLDGDEHVMPLEHAAAFANMLFAITQNMQRGYSLDDLFDMGSGTSDGRQPEPGVPEPGVPEEPPDPDKQTAWEPPGGLSMPRRHYKGGRRAK